ncbi:MAG: response regulator transcription factor [Dehalococcoidia bacterium]|nr:response regulator transcription factor [Dehalococcoidia bacterium]
MANGTPTATGPTHPSRVLVVDDEPNIVRLVRGYLEREGWDIATAADGPAALDLAASWEPDVIVLDVMLPGLDGIEVCRRIRTFSDAYVVMLTARGEEVDRIVGLTVGADDYLVKPFSPSELVARIRAMLRRPRTGAGTPAVNASARQLGDILIDSDRHLVTRAGEPVDLTPREFALLAMLAEQPGRVFTRQQILERVWESEYFDDHVVEVHVANLRRKLADDPGAPRYVQTVRGVGYRAGAPA